MCICAYVRSYVYFYYVLIIFVISLAAGASMMDRPHNVALSVDTSDNTIDRNQNPEKGPGVCVANTRFAPGIPISYFEMTVVSDSERNPYEPADFWLGVVSAARQSTVTPLGTSRGSYALSSAGYVMSTGTFRAFI